MFLKLCILPSSVGMDCSNAQQFLAVPLLCHSAAGSHKLYLPSNTHINTRHMLKDRRFTSTNITCSQPSEPDS